MAAILIGDNAAGCAAPASIAKGYKPLVKVARICDIIAFPRSEYEVAGGVDAPDTAFASVEEEELAKICAGEAFLFEPDTGFVDLNIETDQVGYRSQAPDSVSCNTTWTNTFTIKKCELSKKAAARAKQFQNEKLVFIIIDKDGNHIIMGGQDDPVTLTGSSLFLGGNAAEAEDDLGYNTTITHTSSCPQFIIDTDQFPLPECP